MQQNVRRSGKGSKSNPGRVARDAAQRAEASPAEAPLARISPDEWLKGLVADLGLSPARAQPGDDARSQAGRTAGDRRRSAPEPERQPTTAEPAAAARLETKADNDRPRTKTEIAPPADRQTAVLTPAAAPADVRRPERTGTAPSPNNRMAELIAEIRQRQTPSARQSAPAAAVQPQFPETVQPATISTVAAAGPTDRLMESLRADVGRLAEKVDRMQTADTGADILPAVRGEMNRLQQSVSGLATKNEVSSVEHAVRRLADQVAGARPDDRIERLTAPVAELRGDVKALTETVRQFPVGSIEHAIRSLADEVAEFRKDDRVEKLAVPVEGLRGDVKALTETVRLFPIVPIENAIRTLADHVVEFKSDERFDRLAVPVEKLGDDVRALAETVREPVEKIGSGIDMLDRKIDALAERGEDPRILAVLEAQIADTRELLTKTTGLDEAAVGFDKRLDLISHKLDILTRSHTIDVIDQLDALAAKVDGLAAPLDAQADIAPAIDGLARRIDDALAFPVHRDFAASIIGRLDTLDIMVARSGSASDITGVGHQVRALADRIDDIRDSDQTAASLAQLHQDIADLSHSLNRSTGGPELGADISRALGTLERTMGNLTAHVEALRGETTLAAERAARLAIIDTLGALPTPDKPAARAEADTLRPGVDDFTLAPGDRPMKAVDGAPETLSQMVGRITLEDRRSRQQTTDRDHAVPSLGAAISFDQEISARLAAHPAGSRLAHDGLPRAATLSVARNTELQPATLAPVTAPAIDPKDVKANFIAAARRAAQAAAAETAAGASGRDRTKAATARPSPLGRWRQPLQPRSKSLLMGAATVVLALSVGQISTGFLSGSIADTDQTPGRLADLDQAIKALPPLAAAIPSKPANPFLDSVADSRDIAVESTGSVNRPKEAEAAGADGRTMAALDPNAAEERKAQDQVPQKFTKIEGMADIAAAIPANAGPAGLRTAALGGDPAAIYDLGSRLAEGRGVTRDPKLAAKLFEKAAEFGLAPAQYRLGGLYEKGLGVNRDSALAKVWYERAAAQGNAKAMHNLAVLLAQGVNGKPDYSAAADWFARAAEFGVRDSQYNLAILLARGLGTQQNLVQSYIWFAISAAQGDEDSGKKRDDVGGRLDAADLAKAKAAAESWKAKSPDQPANDVAMPAGGWEAATNPAKAGAKDKSIKGSRV